MKILKTLAGVADQIEATFTERNIRLTLGGEPTYVPIDPHGPEWTVTALGPTKLRYAYALKDALVQQSLPKAVAIYSPGKFYPGEVNPRWAINLVWNRDGTSLVPALDHQPARGVKVDAAVLKQFQKGLARHLGVKAGWLRAVDPLDETRPAAVLPLDHDGTRFVIEDWKKGNKLELLRTEGPAGLRLPLNSLPPEVNRRALTAEVVDKQLHIFLPPLLQPAFLSMLEAVVTAANEQGVATLTFGGYVPSDEAGIWTRLAIAADPGVLEINLPPCATWREYAGWLDILERAAAPAGLRSFKQLSPEDQTGTGGGNHLLFGGPSLEDHPLFTRPAWVTSILRYWQHHPSLAYLFTGQYVGSSSQAPRPDEGASAHYDLEMAYRFLESLPEGDHRYLISETLRHLHTDTSGNTHRSEASFDKFWNVNFDGGCRGLVEFRAVETFPEARWMSAVALLWHALAAHLLARPFKEPLVDLGDKLHDAFFLPSFVWADFEKVLRDLRRGGFALPATLFREIFEWRFPTMLQYSDGPAELTVRRALESWPLLCEQPLEGGSTSRFVDTSIERLEFLATRDFAARYTIHVGGRALPLQTFPGGRRGAGLRYRRTALYPSLHPGIAPQTPLVVTLTSKKKSHVYRLESDRRHFTKHADAAAPKISPKPCHKLHPRLITYDLRLA
ncbi:MAG TPA: transglutaminase family protein [Chthoniobacter sp.]|nr:transglutaminase family protein [Chthoniobacter sp.]